MIPDKPACRQAGGNDTENKYSLFVILQNFFYGIYDQRATTGVSSKKDPQSPHRHKFLDSYLLNFYLNLI